MRFVHSVLIAAAVMLFAVSAFAAETVPFDQNQFAAAQKSGQPILVDIRASWCPTCAAQKSILASLEAKPEFKNLIVFEVDFDTQKDVVRAFKARMQSTLIAFKGAAETGRSVGDTDAGSIEQLLRSTES